MNRRHRQDVEPEDETLFDYFGVKVEAKVVRPTVTRPAAKTLSKLPPPSEAEIETMIAAVDRWWTRYGRNWSKTQALVRHRGWYSDDIRQEVLASVMTKMQGRSRYDASRCDLAGWASVVGRSRILHLLDRPCRELPSVVDPLRGLGAGSDDMPAPEPGEMEWPESEGEPEPVTDSEVRSILGLRVDEAEYIRQLHPEIAEIEEIFGGDE